MSLNHLPLIIASLAEMQILILVSDFVIIMLRENCKLKVVTFVVRSYEKSVIYWK